MSIRTVRPRTAALGCIAVCCGVLAASPAAGAATIHACVKKTSGATRIVGAKAKCRHGEQSLSWNTAGPAGATGASGAAGAKGANGTNGTNGAAAGFVARSTESVPIAAKATVLLSKLLPPGSYILNAKSIVVSSSKAAETAALECGVFEAPGTTPPTEGEAIDEEFWSAPLAKLTSGTTYEVDTTLPFVAGFTSTAATTVDVVCARGTVAVSAIYTQLTAIQVSSLG